jgi:uncharacterized protein
MDLGRLILPWSVKTQGEAGEFCGYLSTFGNIDAVNDVCMPGCFAKSLAAHKAAGTAPALFWAHDAGEPIGEWTSLAENEKGLITTGKLWIGCGIPKAEQAWRMIRGTGPKGLSIGYRTLESGNDHATGVRSLLEIDLIEGSITPFPANPMATVTGAKSASNKLSDIRSLIGAIRAAT